MYKLLKSYVMQDCINCKLTVKYYYKTDQGKVDCHTAIELREKYLAKINCLTIFTQLCILYSYYTSEMNNSTFNLQVRIEYIWCN